MRVGVDRTFSVSLSLCGNILVLNILNSFYFEYSGFYSMRVYFETFSGFCSHRRLNGTNGNATGWPRQEESNLGGQKGDLRLLDGSM